MNQSATVSNAHRTTWRVALGALFVTLTLARVAAQTPAPPVGVTTQSAIVYGQAAGRPLLLDAYLPGTNYARPRPGVLVVHGGGWEGGGRHEGYYQKLATDLAEAGFAAFSVDYRLVRRPADGVGAQNSFPAPWDDCQRAVRWVARHAAEFGVEPRRLGAVGVSAGAHLVALLGTRDTRDNADAELAAFPSRVRAVVDIFGPADLTQAFPAVNLSGITVQGMVDNLVGSTNAAARRAASPQFFIDDRTVPFLIFQGDRDPLVPVAQSRDFAAALRNAGREVAYIEFPGEGHGFGQPENVARVNREMIAFFRRTLGE